jgi:hypothetical protein
MQLCCMQLCCMQLATDLEVVFCLALFLPVVADF